MIADYIDRIDLDKDSNNQLPSYEEELLIALDNNKQTKIITTQGFKIGEGAFGAIKRKIINSHKGMTLVAKTLKGSKSANEVIVNGYSNIWQKLKKANIPTYNTFRTNSNKSIIYMTDLESGGKVCFSTNESLSKNKISSIIQKEGKLEVSNMKELITELVEIAEKAGMAGLSLSRQDIYFFIYNPYNKELHAFIGDFGLMVKKVWLFLSRTN